MASLRPVRTRLRVLVTGSDGFLGQAVVRRLRPAHDVRPFSRRTGSDILDCGAVATAADGCDAIVHLAGLTQGTPAELLRANVLGTANILDAAFEAGARVVFASSAGAARPRNAYGRSKRLAEALAEQYRGWGLPGVAVLRFFNLFGAGDRRSVVARFQREDPITLDGGGQAVRDFLHVDDAADAVARCLRPDGFVRRDVGSGRGLAIREVAKLFNKQVVVAPAPPAGQILRSVARPSGIPGWRPRKDLATWLASGEGRTRGTSRL